MRKQKYDPNAESVSISHSNSGSDSPRREKGVNEVTFHDLRDYTQVERLHETIDEHEYQLLWPTGVSVV